LTRQSTVISVWTFFRSRSACRVFAPSFVESHPAEGTPSAAMQSPCVAQRDATLRPARRPTLHATLIGCKQILCRATRYSLFFPKALPDRAGSGSTARLGLLERAYTLRRLPGQTCRNWLLRPDRTRPDPNGSGPRGRRRSTKGTGG